MKLSKNRKQARYCPCGKSNADGKFVPFEENPAFGYCHACGETFFPKKGSALYLPEEKIKFVKPVCIQPRYVDPLTVQKTLRCYDKNIFVQRLFSLFGQDRVMKQVERYHPGTARNGAVIFWCRDENNNFRSGKKVLYKANGKRHKTINPVELFEQKDGYFPCLYGLHRMKEFSKDGIICLCESEKTAIVSSLFFPQYLWLATGGASGLTAEKAMAIRGRKVMIVPDCDEAGRKAIQRQVQLLEKLNCKVSVCDLFPNLNDGSDIADFLILHAEETKRKEENTPIYKMIKKNPSLQTLIKTFDLLP